MRPAYVAFAALLVLALTPGMTFGQQTGSSSGSANQSDRPDIAVYAEVQVPHGLCYSSQNHGIRFTIAWSRADLLEYLVNGAVLANTSWDCGFVTTGSGGLTYTDAANAGSGSSGDSSNLNSSNSTGDTLASNNNTATLSGASPESNNASTPTATPITTSGATATVGATSTPIPPTPTRTLQPQPSSTPTS